MIPSGCHRNEAKLKPLDPLNEGLVSLIGFKPDRTSYVVGSAFIIEAGGAWAIAVSAAHAFTGIRDAQSPRRRVLAALPTVS